METSSLARKATFDDIEAIQRKHPKEVGGNITDTYNQLKEVSRHGVKFDTVTKAWDATQISSHAKLERSTLQRASFPPSTHYHPFNPLPSASSTDQLPTDSVGENR